jgi:hypothetical protein
VCACVEETTPSTLCHTRTKPDASETNTIKTTRHIIETTGSTRPQTGGGQLMVVGRDRHQGLGTVLSQNERIRQWSRSSGTVPLNSPRLLIRLRICHKSGTVPLNSPRLLIRHWIPSTGLHADTNARGVYVPPDTTDYTIQPPSTYRTRDNHKHDAMHPSNNCHK